ncbi:MAG: DNA/RNA non-specific endonuclease [Candidatus Omnitrophica bacterium]|nr:DNA/RNA non-specific endonuclease [Candidatus Omnitrophota bacterium]
MRIRNKFALGLFVVLSLIVVFGWPSKSQSEDVAKEGVLSAQVKRADDNGHILFGYPGDEKIILKRKGYVVGYNPEKKVADWVSYHFTDAYLVKKAGRSNDFRPDLDLTPDQRAELKDYRHSGYDMGHLAPAADMTRSKQIMSESFLLSNMAPQVGPGFNRGIWRILEGKVRDWVRKKKNIYVIDGPIYDSPDGKTIGPDKVGVPDRFYKIIVSCSEDGGNLDAIAFILPNKKNPNNMLPKFIVSIDEIEKATGLDFLHDFDDTTESKLEAKKAQMW